METKTEKYDKIELRSDKVQQFIDEIPASLTLWGAVIMIVVSATFIATICLFPYPYSHGESILQHLLEQL